MEDGQIGTAASRGEAYFALATERRLGGTPFLPEVTPVGPQSADFVEKTPSSCGDGERRGGFSRGKEVRLLPRSRSLPRFSGGSAFASSLSRPARTSLALRPTGLLNRPRRPLSRGSSPTGCPVRPLVSYQTNRQLSGGTFLHWGCAPSGRTEKSGLARLGKDEIKLKVAAAAASLGLEPLLGRYPRQLSGGQRQRVAMGRAIVRDPKVFLFDEPLSNLDAKLRVQVRGEIKELQRRLKTTTIYVTHDQVEAMTMGDKIVVLNGGRVEQIGAPLDLYDHPGNRFVATFLGSPAMNLIEGTIDGAGTRSCCPTDIRPR